jgi:hypothetical protein
MDKTDLDLDVRLAKLLTVVLESEDELFSFFASSRYSLLLLMRVLLICEERSALSKEECLRIGRDMRSRTHRQNFIDEAIRRGFFAKEPSSDDARQVLIYPTEKTKLLFKEWASAYHQVRRSAFGGD